MTETTTRDTTRVAAEIRVFLIADIRGYTRFALDRGDEAAARLATRFAAICREAASRRGGEVLELRGDEALAVFSSSRAALQAAVDLQGQVAQAVADDPSFPFDVGIGVEAGEAVAVEGGFRGTALNLAARLCSLAGPGEVLASETTITLARRIEGIAYRERGMVPLKGFDHPVRVMEIVPAASDSATQPDERAPALAELPIGNYLGTLPEGSLIGRDAEVARAVALVDAVLAADPTVSGRSERVLLLSGEPGAGKTRLAQEVTVALRNRGVAIAAGRCYEPQQSVPFYPVIDALAALYTQLPPAVQASVPARWPDLGRLLPGLGLPPAASAGQEDQARLFWAVTAFLQAAAAERPAALLFDDLHWADAASLDLLQHLARHLGSSRVLILGTFRDVEVNRRHPLEWVLRDLQREGRIERIDVRRLDEANTGRLIAGFIGDEKVSDEFAHLIYGRTEGNPFFVQQVVRVLAERGDIFRRKGRWGRRDIEELEVPESVRSVVGQRVSRLSERTQTVLQEASVLGETFSFDDLLSLGSATEDDLEAALEEAMNAGLVRDRGRERYAFDHALTRGALDVELSSRRRRRLHLAAGEALEARPERDMRAAELAWHFLQGDDPEKALHWSLAAGDAAAAIFAHNDAEAHYRTALQLAEEEGWDDRAQIAREKLGHTLVQLSQLDDAQLVLEAALCRYRESGDAESELRVVGALISILFDRGRRDEGLALAEPAAARWRRAPVASPGACSLLIGLAELYWQTGRIGDALAASGQAIDLAGRLQDDKLLGRAQGRLGVVLDHAGRSEEALTAYSRSIAASERAGDFSRLVVTVNNRALVHAQAGRGMDAITDLERALALARKVGTPDQLGWELVLRAQTAFEIEGDWPRARALLDELAPLEPYMKGTRSAFQVTMARWIRLEADDDPAMVTDLKDLVEEGERTGDALLWAGAQTWLAHRDVHAGRLAEAIARCRAVHANQGIEEQFRSGVDGVLAHAYIESGELAAAGALIERGRARLGVGSPFAERNWLPLLARLRSAEGRWQEADATLAEVLDGARSDGFILAEGATLLTWAELLSRRGDAAAARTRLREAREIFERVHARYYVNLADRALLAIVAG